MRRHFALSDLAPYMTINRLIHKMRFFHELYCVRYARYGIIRAVGG